MESVEGAMCGIQRALCLCSVCAFFTEFVWDIYYSDQGFSSFPDSPQKIFVVNKIDNQLDATITVY